MSISGVQGVKLLKGTVGTLNWQLWWFHSLRGASQSKSRLLEDASVF